MLDLRLPHASGVDVVRNIRSMDDGRLPILVFSGTVTNADEVRELARAWRCGIRQRVQRGAAHLAIAGAAFVSRQLQSARQPARRARDPDRLSFGNTIAAALTLNLSRGGIAIRTTSPLEPDAKARLRFRLPASKKDIDADARVCWCDTRVGMGLQFERVHPADQKAIDDYVDTNFFHPRKV